MGAVRNTVTLIAIFGCSIFCFSASAADLTGVWATDASACNRIFVKSGTNISFAGDSDAFGGGFIIEGKLIRGKMQTCNIKLIKEDGAVTHYVASCTDDVSFGIVQFSLKIENDSKITRLFDGIPELATSYFRCTL